MWLLQRGMLVEEWKGELVLFGGVPAEWIKPGARIAFRNWVTWYGKVSAELIIGEDGRKARIHASASMQTRLCVSVCLSGE